MPLKGIPFLLSPDLLHVLSSAGHGDEIVLADGHFPTSSMCKHGAREVRADGLEIPPLLEAILKLYPLDPYVPRPVALMDLVPSDKEQFARAPIWDTYQTIVDKAEGKHIEMEYVERFAFYERAKKAYAIIHTGDVAKYGNIILKKGLVIPEK